MPAERPAVSTFWPWCRPRGSHTCEGHSCRDGVATCRGAIHLSLLALYGLGGYLVSRGLMPLRVLLSAVGFTFSLVFATQGCVQTFSDARRAVVSLRR